MRMWKKTEINLHLNASQTDTMNNERGDNVELS